jgi:hypothetical protein
MALTFLVVLSGWLFSLRLHEFSHAPEMPFDCALDCLFGRG